MEGEEIAEEAAQVKHRGRGKRSRSHVSTTGGSNMTFQAAPEATVLVDTPEKGRRKLRGHEIGQYMARSKADAINRTDGTVRIEAKRSLAQIVDLKAQHAAKLAALTKQYAAALEAAHGELEEARRKPERRVSAKQAAGRGAAERNRAKARQGVRPKTSADAAAKELNVSPSAALSTAALTRTANQRRNAADWARQAEASLFDMCGYGVALRHFALQCLLNRAAVRQEHAQLSERAAVTHTELVKNVRDFLKQYETRGTRVKEEEVAVKLVLAAISPPAASAAAGAAPTAASARAVARVVGVAHRRILDGTTHRELLRTGAVSLLDLAARRERADKLCMDLVRLFSHSDVVSRVDSNSNKTFDVEGEDEPCHLRRWKPGVQVEDAFELF